MRKAVQVFVTPERVAAALASGCLDELRYETRRGLPYDARCVGVDYSESGPRRFEFTFEHDSFDESPEGEIPVRSLVFADGEVPPVSALGGV